MYKKIALLLVCLIVPSVAYAADITFAWTHSGEGKPAGFKLYNGDAPQGDKMQALLDVPDGAARKVTVAVSHADIKCYGLSAYNALGESAITVKQDNGEDLCLGKPLAPSAFTYSAK
jgi:hypothetical protein